MDKLLASALQIKQRTMVTGFFARNGFKITMTDFDDMTFEREGVQVNVHFDLNSNAESASIRSKNSNLSKRSSLQSSLDILPEEHVNLNIALAGIGVFRHIVKTPIELSAFSLTFREMFNSDFKLRLVVVITKLATTNSGRCQSRSELRQEIQICQDI